MTTKPTTTMEKLNQLREQFKTGTKQAAEALTSILGVVDEVFDSLQKPIVASSPESKPIVFVTTAQVFIEVSPDCPDIVTKVRILPSHDDVDCYDDGDETPELVQLHRRWVNHNNWPPLEKLPDDVVWEG